jgi:hypothetical protein
MSSVVVTARDDGVDKSQPERSSGVEPTVDPEALDAEAPRPEALGGDDSIADAARRSERYRDYPSFDASLAEAAEGLRDEAVKAPDFLDAFAREAAGFAESDKKHKKKKKGRKLKLQIAHQTAGRVRMTIAGAKGDEKTLKEIARTFGLIPGVEKIAVNAVTGSIILNYNEEDPKGRDFRLTRRVLSPRHDMLGSEYDELARKIENEAEFLAQRSKVARAVVDFSKRLDHDIKRATHNAIDLKIILAVGMIILTIFEIGVHAATPIWLTLAVFSFNHFLELHGPGAAGASGQLKASI